MRLITGFKSKNIPRIMLTIPDKIKKNLLEPLIIIPPIIGTAYLHYTWDHGGCQSVTIKLCFHKTHMSILLTQFYRIPYNTLYLKYELWMGIKVYRSCFQRVAGWCEAIEVVRWHSPVSFGGECSSSHRRWFRYTRNESQLGWYRVMNITPLWATTVVLRGFFIVKV